MVRTIDKDTLTPAEADRVFGSKASVTGNFTLVSLIALVLASSSFLTALYERALTYFGIYTPRYYGGVGDGSTDDTVALQAWIDAAVGRTAASAGALFRAVGTAYLPPGDWMVTAPLKIYSVENFTVVGAGSRSRFVVGGAMTALLDCDGVRNLSLGQISVVASGNAAHVADNVIWLHYNSFGSTTRNSLYHIDIVAPRYKTAIRLGNLTSPGGQTDQTSLSHINITGGWASGETTLWQHGIYAGDGTNGNNLVHNMVNCNVATNRYNIYNAASNVSFLGGCVQNAEVDFFVASLSYTHIGSIRSENSERFLLTGGAAALSAHVTVADVDWHANLMNSDYRWIVWKYGGLLSLTNVRAISPLGGTPLIRVEPSVAAAVQVHGLTVQGIVSAPAPHEMFSFSAATVNLWASGLSGIDSGGTYTQHAGTYQVGAHTWGPHNAAFDTNLYRNGADQLKTDDKLLAALGIGVGNSAAATTPGSVVKKMQVFDASGSSLGYVPIYDAIT